MRTPLVAANWKMHTVREEALRLGAAIVEGLRAIPSIVEVVLCPPFVFLEALRPVLAGSAVQLGAQNVHPEPQGAFTGEVSAPMLRSVGCAYVIVGHSERRRYFRETDSEIGRKVRAALQADLRPILCVGEELAERRSGRAQAVVEGQLEGALAALSDEALDRLVIAYEPVWAIGTGQNATPEEAQEMHAHIRAWARARWGDVAASGLRILYGGSLRPENALELFRQPDIDGGLVGGASLEAAAFLRIVQAAVTASVSVH
ncbi:MAG: triose-phosphate isomerase [Bacteroidetes bacterium]|nr:triose-phosphate isomerase [Rhodothermia bacterium]MCS7154205.1 triose-phosphate isomerase [Bacteroidota bacterium]MCX7906759.1 triose-phosphate isomerase [Bacteroidota bacterium]MDW8285168.1 triose-phosphate isomerase [Bacteroidota bacterium]